jgi:uncharacterized membrane protein YcgQ (UPF0703/DUF1980 family)
MDDELRKWKEDPQAQKEYQEWLAKEEFSKLSQDQIKVLSEQFSRIFGVENDSRKYAGKHIQASPRWVTFGKVLPYR